MEKNEYISEIKSIIKKWGGVTACELELDASPVYNTFGKDGFGLVERFNRNGVTIVCYIHENEVEQYDVDYEVLNKDLLDEVYHILEEYNVNMQEKED